MQPRVDINLDIHGEPDDWVHSACILCSNGCGLDIAVKDGRIVGVRGTADHPVNFGHLGPKGKYGWVANNSKRRGTTPMIRRTKGAPLQPVSWQEAIDFFIEKFKAAWQLGHENLAYYNSGQLTIEELYTLGKLWRGGLQSSNIDGNTRLCTATSATGLMANFGVDGPVASYGDIDQADLLCLYGHNVAEAQTVLWERMLAAKKERGGRIIVADPRRTPTVRQGADLRLGTWLRSCLRMAGRKGSQWWSIRSGRGKCSCRSITVTVPNQLTSTPGDPVSHQPQLKSSPVAVRRLSFGQPEPWLLARLAELNGKINEPFAA